MQQVLKCCKFTLCLNKQNELLRVFSCAFTHENVGCLQANSTKILSRLNHMVHHRLVFVKTNTVQTTL